MLQIKMMLALILISIKFAWAADCNTKIAQSARWYQQEEHISQYVEMFGNPSGKQFEQELLADYEILESLIPNNGKILEVALGSGRDYAYFRNQGYQVSANEYSKELTALARTFLREEHGMKNVRIMNREFLDFKKAEFSRKYDAVWAWASIVHVPLERQAKYLAAITAPLKKDGHILFTIQYNRKPETRSFTIPGQKTGRTMTAINKKELKRIIKEVRTKHKIKLELVHERLNQPIMPGVQWWSITLKRVD